MQKIYYVYILASKRNGTLYIGVTNNLVKRILEHREGLASKFTKKYGVKLLVYYEVFEEFTPRSIAKHDLRNTSASGRSILYSRQILNGAI